MPRARATGTWLCEYTLGEDYGDQAGKSVPFRLSLTERGLGALFARPRVTGQVRDDASKGGFPELGEIRGQLRGLRLSFVKTMPVTYLADENGDLMTITDYYRRHDLEARPRRHVIYYRGVLSDDGEQVRGDWAIPPHMIEFAEGISNVPGSRGTWSGRRTSPLPTEL